MLRAPWQTTQCCSNKGSHAASLQNNQKTKGATFGYHYWRMWLPAGKCVMYSDGSTVLTEAQGNGNQQARQETSAQDKYASFRGFSSAIQKRKGCSNGLPGPFPSESWVLKRLEPVSSPTRTPGCDLGLISVGGGASGSDTVPAPPLPPSLAC